MPSRQFCPSLDVSAFLCFTTNETPAKQIRADIVLSSDVFLANLLFVHLRAVSYIVVLPLAHCIVLF